MANDKVDGIHVQLSADIDSSGVVRGQQAITKAANDIEKEFKDVEKAAAIAGKGTTEFGDKAVKASPKLGGIGKKAGAASIQIQQFTGQISGGVNPLVAFSQQAADLGIVLGAPLIGSVVGIAAAIGVSLLPNVFKSTSALKALEDAAKELDASLKKTPSGVTVLSDSIAKLAKRSEALARIQLSGSIIDAEKRIKVAADGISESLGGIFSGITKDADVLGLMSKIGGSVDEVYAKLQNGFSGLPKGVLFSPDQLSRLRIEIEKVSSKLGISTSQASRLIFALKQFESDKSAVNVKALENTISSLGDELAGTSKKFTNYSKSAIPFFNGVTDGVDDINKLRLAFFNLNAEIGKEKQTDELKKSTEVGKLLAKQLALAQAEADGGAKAARRLAVALELGLDNANKLPDSIKATLTATEELEAEEIRIAKDKAARLEEEIAAKREYAAIIKGIVDSEAASEKEKEKKNEKTTQDFSTLEKDLNPLTNLEKIAEREEAARALTAEYFALKMEDAIAGSALEIQLAQEKQDTLTAIEKSAADQRIALAEAERLAKVRAVGGAFMQLSSLMNSGSQKLFKIGKAAALSGALVNGYAAVMGAIKTGNDIGGPYVGAAFGAAAAVQAAVQIKNIKSQKFGGAGGGSGTFSAGLPAERTTESNSSGGNRSISISGIDANSLISGGQLVETLNAALGDGYTINLAGG